MQEMIKCNHSKLTKLNKKQAKESSEKQASNARDDGEKAIQDNEYSPILDYKNGQRILCYFENINKNESNLKDSLVCSKRKEVNSKAKKIFAKKMGKKDHKYLFSNRMIKSLKEI